MKHPSIGSGFNKILEKSAMKRISNTILNFSQQIQEKLACPYLSVLFFFSLNFVFYIHTNLDDLNFLMNERANSMRKGMIEHKDHVLINSLNRTGGLGLFQ